MAVTTDQYPKPEPVKQEKNKAEEDAVKARFEHNRRLLARARLVTTNVEAIVLDTTTTGTMSTTSPAAETESTTSLHSEEGNNTDDVPETNRSTDLMNMEGSEVKATMVEAKNKDEEEHKVEAKGEKLPEAGKKESNAEGKKKTKNQARSKKAEARRKEGYNKFSVLIEEPEYEKETDIEEDATTTDESGSDEESESSENEQDVEGVEEAATPASTTEEKPDVNWFDPGSRRKEEQHLEAKRAEETATAGKRKEKRKRKKKTKAGELDGSYYPSCGVLCVGLVCILMFFSFLPVS